MRIDNDKLVIEQYDDHTNNSSAGAYKRIKISDFNEEMFDNTQERDDA